MKRKYSLLVTCSSFLLLASCSGGGSISSSSESSSTLPTFSDDEYQGLIGNYHSVSGDMSLTKDNLIFGDLSLNPTKISGEGLETTINYSDSSGSNYVLSLRERSDDVYTLLLTKNGSDVASFMPSIEKYSASYAGYSDDSCYNYYYTIGDYYDAKKDLFKVALVSSSGASDYTYYTISGFSYIEENLYLSIALYDYADDYFYYRFFPTIDEEKGLILNEYSGVTHDFEESWYSTIGMVNFPLLGDGWASWNYYFDAESKQLTMADYVTNYTVSNGYDENGQLIKLVSGEETAMYLRPNLTGLDGYNAAKTYTQSYAYDDRYASWLYKEYTLDDITLSVATNYDENWNLIYSLNVNNDALEADFIIKNAKTAIKTTLNGVETTFVVDKAAISLLALSADKTSYYLNYAAYQDRYVDTYYAVLDGTVSVLSILNGFSVTIDDKEYEGELVYEEGDLEPTVGFSGSGKTYTFASIDTSISYYSLSDGSTSIDFFSESVYKHLNDTFTSTGVDRLIISKGKLGFGENASLPFTLERYTESDGISNFISLKYTDNSEDKRIISVSGANIFTTTKKDGQLYTDSSYISLSGFEKLVGQYRAYGRFGTETIKLTNDGHHSLT